MVEIEKIENNGTISVLSTHANIKPRTLFAHTEFIINALINFAYNIKFAMSSHNKTHARFDSEQTFVKINFDQARMSDVNGVLIDRKLPY